METLNSGLGFIEQLLATYGLRILGSIAIFFIGRALARIIARNVRTLMKRAKVDDTLVAFANSVLYYALIAVVVIAALNNIDISVTSIVAVFGAATLAIGLALQGSLTNFAAGVMIILLRPYKVGDFINAAGATGQVTEVGIFNTVVLTFLNETIIVPNGHILAGNITNYTTAGSICIVSLSVTIGYDDDLLKAKEILLDIMQNTDNVLADPGPSVAVSELGEDGIILALYPYARIEHRWGICAHVTEQIKLRFDEAGISFPYPQRDVHLFSAN